MRANLSLPTRTPGDAGPARPGRARGLLAALATAALAGCTTPMPAADTDAHAVNQRERLVQQIASEEPVTGPITLYEAMARALKYNLDQKIELMEIAMRDRQLEARSIDMLPALVAGVGLSSRSNEAGSRSRSLLSGRESLEPSTSSERQNLTADLALSWDMLDFGIARVRHAQQSNERLIAAERRRKVINRILEDVRTAYWRAVSADRTAKKLADVEALAARALRQAEELQRRRIAPPGLVINYQRDLLQVAGEVQRLQRELTLAKNQLAALINLPPDASFVLVLPNRTDVAPELPGSADAMVLAGLRFRSEMHEALYRRRILDGELKVAQLRALPSVRTVLGFNFDGNDFLTNDQWLNLSARVSWNLLEVFRLPKVKRALEAEQQALAQRDLALTMAVMTQVHVARARFVRLGEELATARKYQLVQEKLLSIAQSSFQARAISQQQLVREALNGVLAEVRYDIAYADLQNAYANLYASMGIDNFDVDLDGDISIKKLAEALEEHWTDRALALPPMPQKPS